MYSGTVKHKDINIGHRPIISGSTVVVDHQVQVFTVVIRSLAGVGVEALKDQLQKKWEIVGTPHCHELDCYVKRA